MRIRVRFLKAIVYGLCAAASIAVSFAVAQTLPPLPSLRLAVLPEGDPDVQYRRLRPLVEHLRSKLAREISTERYADGAKLAEALAQGAVDLAWINAFVWADAHARGNEAPLPVARRREDAAYQSVIVVRVDDAAQSLADMGGKRVAMVAPTSGTGHLAPREFLKAVNALAPQFAGTHEGVVGQVAGARAAAGALSAVVWDRLRAAKQSDAMKLRELARTPEFADFAWVVRPGLDAALATSIRAAFLGLNPSAAADQFVLISQGATGFISAAPEDWQGLADVAKASGWIRPKTPSVPTSP